MTIKTACVDGLPHQQQVGCFAVRTVTAVATHFSLTDGMCIRLHRLRALLLMAIEADLSLSRCRQYRVVVNMTVVAACARHRITVVAAGVPGKAEVLLMAIYAVAVLFCD
jgi:hypothetical protein